MKIITKKLNPNLMVKDVKETVTFYKDMLGFELEMSVPEEAETLKDPNVFFEPIDLNKKYLYALVKNGNVEISFQEVESIMTDIPELKNQSMGFAGTFYIEVENIDDVYQSLKGKVDIIKEPSTTWYGMTELYIRDNNGYILCLAEQNK